MAGHGHGHSRPTTPFIPPNPDDPYSSSPDARHASNRPVIPPQPGAYPAWYATPGPAYPPVLSPYNVDPNSGLSSDWIGFGAAPHAAPSHPPPPADRPRSRGGHARNDGYSSDWIGFGGNGGGAIGGGGGGMPPGAQWYPGMPGPPTGYSAFNAPLPPGGFGAPPPPAAPGYGYGMSPYAGYDGRGHRSTHTTPWHGGGMLPLTPGQPNPPALSEPVTHLARPQQTEGLDTRFMVGPHYGPVLEPLHVSVTRSTLKLNPLLSPAPDDPTKRASLEWNMLFSSAYVHRSTEADNRSWMTGRDEPATFPRVSSLRLISRQFTWVIDVKARRRSNGVTCEDVIDQLSDFFQSSCPKAEFQEASRAFQGQVSAAYHMNRSRMDGVPGGRLGQGLRRCDWLLDHTMFDGIELDVEYVRDRMSLHASRDIPCMFVLNCARRLGMTPEEIRAHDSRETRDEGLT